MNDSLKAAIEKITARQPDEQTAVWMVGEQLKDMLRSEPDLAEIVLRDLDVKGMSLADCEKRIKAWADQNRTGNFSCVTPLRAEMIIRKFYALPERREKTAETERHEEKLIDLADFF